MLETLSLGAQIPPPHSMLRLSVVVPAKNEAYNIRATLNALCHQVDQQGRLLDPRLYEIIVLANNCTDTTASMARAFARAHPDCRLHIVSRQLPTAYAHIGYARRLLMDAAHHRLMQLNRPRGIIASTDGDTVVSPTWVRATLEAVAQGADAVGGRILTHPQSIGRRYYLQDVAYRLLQAQLETLIDPHPADPWPRHFQNFGPSLAVTSECYERAGRLPTLPALEDVRFYEALQRCDARIRHCPHVRVTTSSRAQGRVAFGFSVQLQQWEQMQQEGIPLMVSSATEWMFRFTLQRQVRKAWASRSPTLLTSVALSLNLMPERLHRKMRQTHYFGEFWQWLMALPEVGTLLEQTYPTVSIDRAIIDLRQCVRVVSSKRRRISVALRPRQSQLLMAT